MQMIQSFLIYKKHFFENWEPIWNLGANLRIGQPLWELETMRGFFHCYQPASLLEKTLRGMTTGYEMRCSTSKYVWLYLSFYAWLLGCLVAWIICVTRYWGSQRQLESQNLDLGSRYSEMKMGLFIFRSNFFYLGQRIFWTVFGQLAKNNLGFSSYSVRNRYASWCQW